MQKTNLGKSELVTSRLIYGCMRIVGDGSAEAIQKGKNAVLSAFDAGYTHFDHADIYGGGSCERLFGQVLKENPGMREKIVLTSKCCIKMEGSSGEGTPKQYDASKEYIVTSVEESLKRLGIERLDILLIHRPDFLLDPSEVGEAFADLRQSGKVAHFGVSNFRPSLVTLLQSNCEMPLIANQVEINIHNTSALTDGTLDQCLENEMSPQAWCPIAGVAYPAWGNTFTSEDEARIGVEFDRQAERYGVENWVIALAWLLKHPSKILPIVGSTTPERIKAAKVALELHYERDDWYRLLLARDGKAVP